MVSATLNPVLNSFAGSPTGIAPPAEQPQARRGEQGDLYCSSEARILVLDDDQAVCRVIQSALAQNSFTVDTVSDPAQVEATLRSRPYHIIILDYVLPGLESNQG